MNIQDIFMEEIHTDTVRSINPLAMLRKDSLMNRTERECRFRIQEEDEKHKLAAITTKLETDGLIFHRPKQGMIATHFAPRKHSVNAELFIVFLTLN